MADDLESAKGVTTAGMKYGKYAVGIAGLALIFTGATIAPTLAVAAGTIGWLQFGEKISNPESPTPAMT